MIEKGADATLNQEKSRFLKNSHASRFDLLSQNQFLKDRIPSWIAGLPAHVTVDIPKKLPFYIAIGGGKGGVGKSILSANLASRLGQMGFKVLLVDLDIGGANLHTYFGLNLPSKTLTDFILFGDAKFDEILLPTPVNGLSLAAGGKDESWTDSADFNTGAFSGLWDALLYAQVNHGFDFVLLDLGAGTHKHTIDFFTFAHLGIVTVLPEPTSIENAYSFLKASMWRIIENAGMQLSSCAAADEIKEHLFHSTDQSSHLSKLHSLYDRYPILIQHILKALQGRIIGFIVNQIRSQKDIEIGLSMETICRNYFGYDTRSLGYLNYDDAAWKSLRNRRLLLLDFPHSIIAKRMGEIAKKLLEAIS